MNDEIITRQWQRPQPITLSGQYVRLEPLDWDRHGSDFEAHLLGSNNDSLWTYMNFGPFETLAEFKTSFDAVRDGSRWVTYTIIDQTSHAAMGMVSFMRIREPHGSAEVGCVMFGPKLRRTRGATEAIYLMGHYLMGELGYRRYEWKCHNGNEASKRAAIRFGFTFEGIFRKDVVAKTRNRDTAWFSITDDEWPDISEHFIKWLHPDNFDANGMQLSPLRITSITI